MLMHWSSTLDREIMQCYRLSFDKPGSWNILIVSMFDVQVSLNEWIDSRYPYIALLGLQTLWASRFERMRNMSFPYRFLHLLELLDCVLSP